MVYAGIGSRETPWEVCDVIFKIAQWLKNNGFRLRSGGARQAKDKFAPRTASADLVFEAGAKGSQVEVYRPDLTIQSWRIVAERYHPAWNRLDEYSKNLHARNAAIILGPDLSSYVDFVLCWTCDGQATGGTGQGIRIAHAYNIPVFNLCLDPQGQRFWEWLYYQR